MRSATVHEPSKNSSQPALPEDWETGGFGIYVHWPFCEAKCPYCDFNSHVARVIDHDAWRAAYLEEIDRFSSLVPGRAVSSIFFGGGTPSLMRPDTVAAIIDRIQARWPVRNSVEITLEANPSSVEASRFHGFRLAGVNRVSLGIQALDDGDLKRLGRLHDVSEALVALDIARSTFDRVSFDLIYGRQDQSLDHWEQELRHALSFGTDHLSLYQLTVESGTAFGDRFAAGRLKGLPSEDLGADMFCLTRDLCAAHGLPAYEISNHARNDAEARHNLVYWRSGDYVGIGPGAHGRLTIGGQRYATEQAKAPGQWLKGERDLPWDVLDQDARGHEFLLMGLRLQEGIELARYQRISGRALSENRIEEMVNLGYVEQHNGRLKMTEPGFAVLNAVLAHLTDS